MHFVMAPSHYLTSDNPVYWRIFASPAPSCSEQHLGNTCNLTSYTVHQQVAVVSLNRIGRQLFLFQTSIDICYHWQIKYSWHLVGVNSQCLGSIFWPFQRFPLLKKKNAPCSQFSKHRNAETVMNKLNIWYHITVLLCENSYWIFHRIITYGIS